MKNTVHTQHRNPAVLWVLLIGCILLVLGVLLTRLGQERPNVVAGRKSVTSASPSGERSTGSRSGHGAVQATAEEIVTSKVHEFAGNRLRVAHALAKRANAKVPPDVEAFFEAAEAEDWEKTRQTFEALQARMHSDSNEDLRPVWSAVHETFGVVEIAREWPAQQLLDYGQAILGSLKPGMVYVGGTDAGRYIPTLLNETSGGERHVILTQNALADRTYLDYVQFLNEEQMSTLGGEDSDRVFSEYLADAQKRATHDRDNPDAPSQLRPGEDVRIEDNRVAVSGQVAVMTINEKLLTMLMAKNPELSFALEESFPFKSTYDQATPLGPVMELRSPTAETTWTAETAASVVDYWRAAADKVLADTDRPPGAPERKAYSQMASAQAALLSEHGLQAEAEQTYRLALTLSLDSPNPVFGYVQTLLKANKSAEAIAVAEAASRAAPHNQTFSDLAKNIAAAKRP